MRRCTGEQPNTRKRIARTLCLLGLLLLWQSCAATGQLGESRATLWKVQGDHNTVYLLGTIHVLSKQAYPLKPALERAFDDANQVVFKAVGKPVLGLETLRDQAEIFDRFNDEQNEQYLLSTLSGLPSYARTS